MHKTVKISEILDKNLKFQRQFWCRYYGFLSDDMMEFGKEFDGMAESGTPSLSGAILKNMRGLPILIKSSLRKSRQKERSLFFFFVVINIICSTFACRLPYKVCFGAWVQFLVFLVFRVFYRQLYLYTPSGKLRTVQSRSEALPLLLRLSVMAQKKRM